MNMTADADVIQELDEGETFRPNPDQLEEQITRKEANNFVTNYKSKFKLDDSKSKNLSKMNSGRTR